MGSGYSRGSSSSHPPNNTATVTTATTDPTTATSVALISATEEDSSSNTIKLDLDRRPHDESSCTLLNDVPTKLAQASITPHSSTTTTSHSLPSPPTTNHQPSPKQFAKVTPIESISNDNNSQSLLHASTNTQSTSISSISNASTLLRLESINSCINDGVNAFVPLDENSNNNDTMIPQPPTKLQRSGYTCIADILPNSIPELDLDKEETDLKDTKQDSSISKTTATMLLAGMDETVERLITPARLKSKSDSTEDLLDGAKPHGQDHDNEFTERSMMEMKNEQLQMELEIYKTKAQKLSNRLQDAEDTVARLRTELVSVRKQASESISSDHSISVSSKLKKTDLSKLEKVSVLSGAKEGAVELGTQSIVAAAAAESEGGVNGDNIVDDDQSQPSPILQKPPLHPSTPPAPAPFPQPQSSPHLLTSPPSKKPKLKSLLPITSPPSPSPPPPEHQSSSPLTSLEGRTGFAALESEINRLRIQIRNLTEASERRVSRVKQKAAKQKAEFMVLVYELREEIRELSKLQKPPSSNSSSTTTTTTPLGGQFKPPSPISLSPISTPPSQAIEVAALKQQLELKNQVIMELSLKVSELDEELKGVHLKSGGGGGGGGRI
ncbi:hypothetical protein HDU76_000004 [Blyttiomyces sp. JEL0837]|nr:hypothetical protein HDU76_000004 [Blyttiomyces sp. JEL0837]